MKRLISVLLCSLFFVSVLSLALPSASTEGYTLRWNEVMEVEDVAVSKNSLYVAAVNNTGVYFYSYNDSTLRWWYNATEGTSFKSVAISASGNYVVAGTAEDPSFTSGLDNNIEGGMLGHIFYWADATTLTGLQNATWISVQLGEEIERGILDISDDGTYVAAGGSGWKIWYFDNCTERTVSDQAETWEEPFLPELAGWVLALDMSSNGKYIAAGGYNQSSGYGAVKFYKDAWSGPDQKWLNSTLENYYILDVAVSDDGYAVAAVDLRDSLYYWADAANLSGNPSSTYYNSYGHDRVDMSADGNETVAVSPPQNWLILFSNSREGLTNYWTKQNDIEFYDVAISEDGKIIATPTRNQTFNTGSVESDVTYSYWAYFFYANGSLVGPPAELYELCDKVSMSGYGRVVAVGSGSYSHLYVYELYTLQSDGNSTDVVGVGQDVYFDNEVVYATGSGFPSNAFVDVYIVNDYTWSDNMTIPDDLSNDGVNTVMTDDVGDLGPADVWQPPLTPDEYDMVFDVNQNGVYDAGIDVVDDPNHPGFIVETTQAPEPAPVGGEIAQMSALALFAPWIILAIAVLALGYTVARRKSILH